MAHSIPFFDSTLPPDLFGNGNASAALNAASAITILLRVHAIRGTNNIAAIVLTDDSSMHEKAVWAMTDAYQGLGKLHAILAGFDGMADLNPYVRDLFALAGVDGPDTLQGIAAYMAMMKDIVDVAQRHPDRLAARDYDRLANALYDPLQPALIGLGDRIDAARTDIRERLVGRAGEARDRASRARATIEDIARTVRLISLNARVEAARAGAHGRAFGVIAEEIKTLSEQTEEASAGMGDSVEEIMSHVRML